ncbi:MAG: GntR family transcriptional regulator [Fimbriimonas sp.]
MQTLRPVKRFPGVLSGLREIALGVGAGNKLPTLNELAAQLQVSRATVVKAIEALEAQGVLRRRHGSGIFAADDLGRQRVLILFNSELLGDISPVWGVMLRQLIRRFPGPPELLSVQFTTPRFAEGPAPDPLSLVPDSFWADIRAKRYAAVLIVGADSEIAWEIERLGGKTVSHAAAGRYVVNMSDVDICQQGVTELVRRGCQRIGVFGATTAAPLAVAAATLSQFGLKLAASGPGGTGKPTVTFPENRADLTRKAYEDALAVFANGGGPDAVILLDDMYAQGFLHGIQRSGLEVGRDVQVATHTNMGAPTLIGFEDRAIRLEYDTDRLVSALLHAVQCVCDGVTPTEFGWDSAVVVEGRTGEIEILSLQAKLLRND